MDGEITIGVGLKTDKFDKQIADLEKKLHREEDKGIEFAAEIDVKQEQIEKAKNALDKIPQSLDEANAKMMELATQMDNMDMNTQEYELAEQKLNELIIQSRVYEELWKKLPTEISRQEAKIDTLKVKQEQVNDKVEEYKQKIATVEMNKHIAEVDNMKNAFNKVGSSIQNSIKQVARLALGLFALRSAYAMVRQASSTLAQYDSQYATNLEYIRYALAQAIAPVLRYIVNLAATLLSYIYAILNAWFGIGKKVDVSAKSFNKMKAGAGGVAKAVKEIKKQLAGFDEINMLSDQSDSGAGGGGGAGGVSPGFDLSSLQGDVPKWLQWIIDNKDLILAVLAGITAALIGMKVFGLDPIQALGIGLAVEKLIELIGDVKTYIEDPCWENFAKIMDDLAGFVLGIGIFFKSWKLAGLALLIGGVTEAVDGLIKYLKDPTFENFGKFIEGLGKAIIGLGIIIGNVPLIIAGVVATIVGLVIKNWEKIRETLQKAINWFSDKSEWIRSKFGNVIGAIYDYFVARLQAMLNFANNIVNAVKEVFNGIITFFKGVFTGNWSQAWEGLKQIVSGVFNGVLAYFNYLIEKLQAKLRVWGEVAGNVFGGAFKGVVNGVLSVVERVLNAPIRAINGLIGVINAVPGINLSRLSTFSLPRMKTGAIINMPNKGTLVGGGIAGEAGREGILPLTDTQAMATLGEEIGKHVLVNLTNITEMNGRVLARQVKQITNEQNFAYNA